MNLTELAHAMPKRLGIAYVTADKISIKLWRTKPRWYARGQYWIGDACVGFLDCIEKVNFGEYRNERMKIEFSECLIKIT